VYNFVYHPRSKKLPIWADRIFIMSSHPGTIAANVQALFDRRSSLELKDKTEFHDLELYVLGRMPSAPGIGGRMRVSV
jgi:hypothetical protein